MTRSRATATVLAFLLVTWSLPALAQSPQAAAGPNDEAERLLAEMDWARAAAAYAQVVRREPTNAQAWLRLGIARANAGDDREAVAAFEQAGQLGLADSPKLAWEAARVYARLGNDEKTIEWLATVVDGGLRSRVLTDTAAFAFLKDDPAFQALTLRATGNDRSCTPPEYAALDFWIGRWLVYDEDRVQAGTDTIERTPDGCAIVETWQGTLGDGGRSLNFYDARTQRWNQVWVGDTGGVVLQQGVATNGQVRFQGETVRADGTKVLNRLTIAPAEGGRVRQLAEISTDGGGTWEPQFDFTYVRIVSRAP